MERLSPLPENDIDLLNYAEGFVAEARQSLLGGALSNEPVPAANLRYYRERLAEVQASLIEGRKQPGDQFGNYVDEQKRNYLLGEIDMLLLRCDQPE
jgi:hypothetical protein